MAVCRNTGAVSHSSDCILKLLTLQTAVMSCPVVHSHLSGNSQGRQQQQSCSHPSRFKPSSKHTRPVLPAPPTPPAAHCLHTILTAHPIRAHCSHVSLTKKSTARGQCSGLIILTTIVWVFTHCKVLNTHLSCAAIVFFVEWQRRASVCGRQRLPHGSPGPYSPCIYALLQICYTRSLLKTLLPPPQAAAAELVVAGRGGCWAFFVGRLCTKVTHKCMGLMQAAGWPAGCAGAGAPPGILAAGRQGV